MNTSYYSKWIFAVTLILCNIFLVAQEKQDEDPLDKLNISGLKFRSIGPALTSGRISDFSVLKDNPYTYYVATSSGGVWKTINAGTTFSPIFDTQGSYSIGCVTVDPNNPNIVWVGTGENNNQRSVAYGDGVYRSEDGGSTWKNMGLKNSEHIGKIIVHPENSNIIYVAAIGPLWSSGGDRGVYKTEDGGVSWNLVLEIDQHTGVSDLVMDPRNPDVLYATSLQRRRHVFTYLGGGPGSGIYKTTNAGTHWEKANKGLPEVDLGRIGLAISPADPEIIYAIVEAAQGKGGFYSSTNRAASWQKKGSYVSSGNYYQEIIADPIDANTVYAMDTWMRVSHDGGENFKIVGEDFKHVDNHCMWIDSENTEHWLVGCDGGIYETWDGAKTWDFKANLPITQFYKVALDNDVPFYNVYGGTQDNFSLGGPSRSITAHGIQNSDWIITHGGDGFESQVDPENPDIVYAQSQYGVLVRYDRKSGEEVGIQPKERKGEKAYRWNWDAPLAVSQHGSGKLYFAANKVFKSEDFGNSWKVISEDLSRQVDRNELEVMDRIWGIDAVSKNRSTSPYGTIVSFAESPLNEDLLIVGTDDGLVQISEDGGQNWRKVDAVKGGPERSYVNSVYASQHDQNVIYIAFNHHKYGDFKPYLFKSMDKGKKWENITSNLPEKGSIYSIEEDHVSADLLFTGTEYGIFFSPDGGEKWKRMKAGLPTIAVRDLAIQRRENDLVLGTFGRGFYILDDYSSLRNVQSTGIAKDAQLFPVRPSLQFEKSLPLGLPGKAFQGDSYYTAENLGPVALITYYYAKDTKSLKDQRRKNEKELAKDAQPNAYPSYEELLQESEEYDPELIFTIKDESGTVIRTISKSPSKGIQRFSWDLRFGLKEPVNLSSPSFYNPFAGVEEGTLVPPGTYTVNMSESINGQITDFAENVSIEVKPLANTIMPATDRKAKVEFQQKVTALSAEIQIAQQAIRDMNQKLKYIKVAMKRSDIPINGLISQVKTLESKLKSIQRQLNGDPVAGRLDIELPPTPATRINWISFEQKYSTSNPTQTHLDSYKIAEEEFLPIKERVRSLVNTDMKNLENILKKAGAPYTPGREIIHQNNP